MVFLRSHTYTKVYLFSHFQTSGRVWPDPQLLQDGQAALPHGRVRAAVRGGAGVLGPRQQSGRGIINSLIHNNNPKIMEWKNGIICWRL